MSLEQDDAEMDLATLFVAHRTQMRRIALAIVGNTQWADDVVQDAYLKLLGARTALVVERPLGYCYQVVRNTARDHHRRSSLEAGLMMAEEAGQHAHAVEGQPEQQAMRRQNLAILDGVLSTVPPRTRVAFEMYFVRGMTQRDIGKTLDVSIGLVNGMIADATQILTQYKSLLMRE